MQSLCKQEKCTKRSRQLGLCPTHASQYYRAKNRAKALAYLGGKCKSCGTTEKLEFDHINPEDVSFRISQNLAAAWLVLKAELDKCQLLCRTCHWIKTCKDQNKISHELVSHGTTNAYCNYYCRCELCKKAWADYNRNRKRGV